MAVQRRTDSKLQPRHLTVQRVPIRDVRPWARNPRKHTKKDITWLAEKIRLHGFRSPLVVWRRDGSILKGNLSWKAARHLGMTHIPVCYVDFATEEQAADYALADNKASERVAWDEVLLAELMSQRSGVDMTQLSRRTGFSEREITGFRQPEKEKARDARSRAKCICPRCGHKFVCKRK